MAGKKETNGNSNGTDGNGQTRSASSNLDRAIFAAGPSKTTSVGSGDLERIALEYKRISKIST